MQIQVVRNGWRRQKKGIKGEALNLWGLSEKLQPQAQKRLQKKYTKTAQEGRLKTFIKHKQYDKTS